MTEQVLQSGRGRLKCRDCVPGPGRGVRVANWPDRPGRTATSTRSFSTPGNDAGQRVFGPTHQRTVPVQCVPWFGSIKLTERNQKFILQGCVFPLASEEANPISIVP